MFKNLFKRAPTQAVRQRPVCRECGAPGIEAHASVSWNEQIQDWQISDIQDYHGNCSTCGNIEAKITWQNY